MHCSLAALRIEIITASVPTSIVSKLVGCGKMIWNANMLIPCCDATVHRCLSLSAQLKRSCLQCMCEQVMCMLYHRVNDSTVALS